MSQNLETTGPAVHRTARRNIVSSESNEVKTSSRLRKTPESSSYSWERSGRIVWPGLESQTVDRETRCQKLHQNLRLIQVKSALTFIVLFEHFLKCELFIIKTLRLFSNPSKSFSLHWKDSVHLLLSTSRTSSFQLTFSFFYGASADGLLLPNLQLAFV